MQESQPGSIGLRLLAVVVLVVANAFFVAAEFALVSARRTRIEALIREGDRKAKAVRAAQQDLYRQLSAAQLGITVASILLGFVAEDTVAYFFRQWLASLPTWLAFLGRAGVASVIALSLISFLHVVFGEQAPKAVAITHPEAVSRWVATPLLIFSWITRPATGLLNSSANWLIRLMGITGASPELERIHSPEEIRMLVEQSEEGGSLQQEDARLLEGVFEFSEKTAQEVMTPRTQMAALEAELSVEAAADQVAITGRSRYHRRGARQGHPGRAPLPARTDHSHDPASTALRARHPRGGGCARRHEAAQDPPGHRARRIRRNGWPGDHGGPAGRNRRADLRRA
jgi:CBS domain containing-hemolysin-like protein